MRCWGCGEHGHRGSRKEASAGSRERERGLRDLGQEARFGNSGALRFTGTSVFFTVSRNVPVHSPRGLGSCQGVCAAQPDPPFPMGTEEHSLHINRGHLRLE